jgi:beta-N-acetylhexosaminidase
VVFAGLVLLALWGRQFIHDEGAGPNVTPARERATPAAAPTTTPAPPRETRARPARVPAAVRAQAARMSRAQQVAQLFLVGFEGTDASAFPALRSRGWGGLLMTADNVLSPDQGAVLLGEAAVEWKIRPLVAATDVAGLEGPVQSPQDRPAVVRRLARSRAAALRAAGVSLVLAPDANVGFEAAEGTFGDDPKRVAALADAAVRGFRAGGVVPAPGRFPGEGAANQDPLEGPSTVGLSADELAARDLLPFRRVARSAPAVVVSSAAFSAYDPVTPASLTPAIVEDLLRGELGFQGVAVSAELAGVTASTGGSVADAAVQALRAGIDMVQISEPADAEAAYRAVLEARIPRARLQEALLRILALKRAAG